MTRIFCQLLFLVCFCSLIDAQDSSSADNACISCAELANLNLPGVQKLEATLVEETTSYCQLLGTIGKEINFELLLPSQWNERFVMGGGGGFVGSIQNSARHRVHEGYATVGTDTGHKGSGIKADWAYNNMERQLNYGHLAVHRTAEVAKVIITRYYCQAPQFNYFVGCSRGGGQGMHEAQRYPTDFDGIVSAAPVISFTATGAEFIQNAKALYPDPEHLTSGTISADHIALLQQIVLEQCDELDAVSDNIISDPRACNFDYSKLPTCANHASSSLCFTPDQVAVIKAIYSGPTDGDQNLYPGFPYGCEAESGGWLNWIIGPDENTMKLNFPSLQFAFGTEMFKYLIFNDENWNYADFDFSNYIDETRYAASYLDATSTDYSAFQENGGKLIFYHGWNDPALSAFTTIEHFEAVREVNKEYEDFLRLYLLPGVLHCGGGPGPNQADWLQLVRDWVELGKAPDKVILTKRTNEDIVISRPVFPYPAKSVYIGSGDPNDEANYLMQKP